ncbi:unnamed protein product, partial [Choristocarpus tenellus]
MQVKSWLAGVVARSQKLSDVMGADWSAGQMSTIMRYRMGAVHQFEMGMVSVVDLKYKVARDLIKHKPCLQKDNKQIIHDRAVAMGDDDPLKADYSRFVSSTKKSIMSDAVMLSHGHLENYSYWRGKVIINGVIKLQNVYRGKVARNAAEKMAKRQAFLSAEVVAREDARKRVTEEILKRETESGVARMKWDAKVRMKQAKLRAAGDVCDRQGVIQAMIEDSVKVAQDSVSQRFKIIAEQRGITDIGKLLVIQGRISSSDSSHLGSATALTHSEEHTLDSQKILASQLLEVNVSNLKELLLERGAMENLGKDQLSGINTLSNGTWPMQEDQDAPIAGDIGLLSSRVEPMPMALSRAFHASSLGSGGIDFSLCSGLSRKLNLADIRKRFMTIGLFPPELYYVGESFEESHHRLQMAQSDPPEEELKARIQSWDSIMTNLRTTELLKEFPCKRLLMKYVKGFVIRAPPSGNLQAMVVDLSTHFQIVRNGECISSILVNLLNSDTEFGLVMKSVQSLKIKHEVILTKTAQIEVEKGIEKAEEDYVHHVNVAKVQNKSTSEVLETAQRKEAKEIQKRVQVKYLEIINVCNDFLETAKHIAVTVVDEKHMDVAKKTIQPIADSACHGRGVEGNRGDAGRRYKFEAFNIRFKVCCDDHGIFNGDDEAAAKGAGGRDRLGALEYMKQHQPGMAVPLSCIVDYHGFRVLAVAKAPICSPVFTKSGKLRRGREELVHGTIDQGKTIRNENRFLNSKLQEVAKKLNLSQHYVKGTNDLNTKGLWASADLRVYRSGNDFYLLNFWRAFPSEDPEATPHLQPTARGQSIFWRGLRPELVQSNPVALSPDANLLVTHGTSDWCKQAKDVFDATHRLVNEVIPQFAEELMCGEVDMAVRHSFNVTRRMHRRGIGVRHMGLLRDMFWRKLLGNVDISYNSSHLRTRFDLRKQLQRGDQVVRIAGNIYTISLKAKHEYSASGLTLDRKVFFTVEFLNMIVGSHDRTNHFWKEELLWGIRDRFGSVAIDQGEEDNILWLLQGSLVYIVHRLQDMLGFSLSNTCTSHFYDRPSGFHFTTLDLSNTPLRIKHNLPMLEFAEASIVVMRANQTRSMGYIQLVQKDNPHFYLTLQERKGSKVAVNHGKGGISLSGYYTDGIKFERPGPIANDSLNRAVYFSSTKKCRIDTKHTGKVLAPMLAHQPFSVEAWVRCVGGEDTTRTVLMTGRYTILVTRKNIWAVTVSTNQGAEYTVLGPPVSQAKWTHMAATYDGTIVRMYANSELVGQVELQEAVERQEEERRVNRQNTIEQLIQEEANARERCKDETEDQAKSFFKTKEGKAKISKAASNLFQKAEFALQMDKDAAKKGIQKLTRSGAKAQAKLEYKRETEMFNMQKIAQEYKRLRDEVEHLSIQERDEVMERAQAPLRVGATCNSKRSTEGRNFFGGDLCHIAVYLSNLSSDSVRAHYLAGTQASCFESDRLYVLAGVRFEAALEFAPNDREIISQYAQSIVNFLELESVQTQNPQRSQKKVREAVGTLIKMENWDGIAEVMKRLPSDSFCKSFRATMEAVPQYYNTSRYLPLDKLAHMPKKFSLDNDGAEHEM